MPAGRKMPLSHQCDHQLTGGQCINDFLRFFCRAAFHLQAKGLRCAWNKGMIGTAAGSPISVIIRPFCHFHRVNRFIRQAGYYHSHCGGTAAIPTDVVCPVRLVSEPFVSLVVVHHRRGAIGEGHTLIGCYSAFITRCCKILVHPVVVLQPLYLGNGSAIEKLTQEFQRVGKNINEGRQDENYTQQGCKNNNQQPFSCFLIGCKL
ncbi:hypothetical protein DOT_5506 [Desulfosporosinus sp. OT]|nr:hypothetical protein DOT_5506 [Desulfosporosinus sp. OT]